MIQCSCEHYVSKENGELPSEKIPILDYHLDYAGHARQQAVQWSEQKVENNSFCVCAGSFAWLATLIL